MNKFISTFILALPLVAIANDANQKNESLLTVSTITLQDGSVLNAEFTNQAIRGSTLFLKKTCLSPSIVRSLAFDGTNGEARATLINNDTFAIRLSDRSYKVKSSLGELEIPTSKMKKVIFQSKRDSSEGLIFHCTFDSLESVQKPAVGPAACYNKATLAPGKEGNALRTQTYTPQAAYDLPPNFLGKAGCIEFWAKILKQNSSVGWGGDPRFFSIRDKVTGAPFFMIDIVSNNGGGNSGFATWSLPGNFASISGMRSLTYQELFDKGSWRDWHHYAIVWDDSGIKGIPEEGRRAALFVDGKPTPCARFDAQNAKELERLIATSSRLSFTYDPDQDHERQTKSPFLIDEFKIWNYAKTEFNLAD